MLRHPLRPIAGRYSPGMVEVSDGGGHLSAIRVRKRITLKPPAVSTLWRKPYVRCVERGPFRGRRLAAGGPADLVLNLHFTGRIDPHALSISNRMLLEPIAIRNE